MNTMTVRAPGTRPVGELLREWRERRLSQLNLAIQADISARHLSFVETGRSQPTAGMILRLTEQLQIPLRERNVLLLAGGYAPAFPQHDLQAPELDSVRAAPRSCSSRRSTCCGSACIRTAWRLASLISGSGERTC